MGYKSKRSRATDIPQKVKKTVWERDGGRCIFCGSPLAWPNMHYIPRSRGGLGIEQNIVTGCVLCHRLMDQSPQRKAYLQRAREYLRARYKGWNEKSLVFRKWNGKEESACR